MIQPTGQPQRVLVVDDEPDVRGSLRRYLEDRDFEVREAENGRVGLELFRAWRPHLVLVDLRMPEVDGLEVLAAIRAEAPEVPVLVVSGTGILTDVIEAQRLGAWDYVLKPIMDLGLLLTAIEHCLERARLMDENRRYQATLEQQVARQTEAIQTSLAQLETIIRVSPLAIVVVDLAGNVQQWNPAAEQLFGWTAAEVVGGPMRIVPPDKQAEHELLRAQVLSGQTLEVEVERLCKDGTRVEVGLSTAPLYDAAGQIAGRMAIITNITERKRAEIRLRISEERYRHIFENALVGIFQCTPAGRFLSANQALAILLGYAAPAELMAAVTDIPAQLYVHPAARQTLRERLAEQGEVTSFETQLRRRNGEVVWTQEHTRVVRGSQGQVIYEGVLLDITARRQAEAALQESEAQYRTLFDGITDAVFVHALTPDNRPGAFLAVNDVACQRLGYTRAEFLQMTVAALDAPESTVDVRTITEQLRRGERVLFEQTHVTKAGRRLPVEVNVQSFEMQGQLVALSVARDISERQRAEAALRESEMHHRQLADENARLLREVNHRVGNNLALLATLVEVEVKRAPTTEARLTLHELLGRINSIADVHQLLQSRHWEPLALDYLAYQVVSGVLAGSPLHGRVLVRVVPLAEPGLVGAKQAANLALLFNELTINCLKHAFHDRLAGQIEIRLQVRGGKRARLEFRDDGPGWPEAVLREGRVNVGLDLLQTMVRHSWQGEVHLRNDGGAVFECEFELEPVQ